MEKFLLVFFATCDKKKLSYTWGQTTECSLLNSILSGNPPGERVQKKMEQYWMWKYETVTVLKVMKKVVTIHVTIKAIWEIFFLRHCSLLEFSLHSSHFYSQDTTESESHIYRVSWSFWHQMDRNIAFTGPLTRHFIVAIL